MASIKRLVPLMDRLLVKRIEAVKVTKGGIILARSAIKKNPVAEVVAVGPGNRNSENGKYTPLAIKVGDRVLLPENGGVQIRMNGVDKGDDAEYFLFRESEIIAKLE